MATTRRRVRYATIFVFPAGTKGVRVSSAPERLTVRQGDIVDWTVVNACSGAAGLASITWKEGNPLKRDPKPFERFERAIVGRAKPGLYKYSILLDGKEVFDPEIEVVS